jgi:hypothetical protein
MADPQVDQPDRLIFIYNADGGVAQGIMDSIHKIVSPSTYACSLCAITHGAFTMDKRWRRWLDALPVASLFYHRDDSPYPEVTLPAVLIARGDRVETLVPAGQLNALESLDDLIAEIEKCLQATRSRTTASPSSG